MVVRFCDINFSWPSKQNCSDSFKKKHEKGWKEKEYCEDDDGKFDKDDDDTT